MQVTKPPCSPFAAGLKTRWFTSFMHKAATDGQSLELHEQLLLFYHVKKWLETESREPLGDCDAAGTWGCSECSDFGFFCWSYINFNPEFMFLVVIRATECFKCQQTAEQTAHTSLFRDSVTKTVSVRRKQMSLSYYFVRCNRTIKACVFVCLAIWGVLCWVGFLLCANINGFSDETIRLMIVQSQKS